MNDLFDEILAASSPPSDPFDVTLPQGAKLVFRAVGGALELEGLEAEGRTFAKELRARLLAPATYHVSHLPSGTARQAHMLSRMMVGVRRGTELIEGSWDRIKWCEFADKAARTFDWIWQEVDAVQLGFTAKLEDEAVDKLGEASGATHDEPAS